MKKKRVSLSDIALSLGVSRSLVSLVLNGKDAEQGISAETQKRVIAKALELSYKPNHFARGLRLGKSFTIGLIVSDIANGFYSRIARNIEDLAEEHGYNLIICSTDEDIEREQRLIKLLRSKQVDGIIISSSQENPVEFNKHYAEGFPIVLIDRYFKGLEAPCVAVKNRDGSKQVAAHLLKQGYSNPLVLAIDPAHVYTIRERCEGFVAEMKKHSIIPVVEHIPFEDTFKSVERLVEKLLKKKQLPDSIFALNNNLATACLLALRKFDINIPDQIGLVCFDDVPFFSFMHPSITSIAQPVDDISSSAFEMLMHMIKEESKITSSSPKLLPIEFLIRESTVKNR
jgi:LacI family transcriptional regulator